jgi:[histone H3]-trimethyl-L-lysine9/36 demethylase
MDERCGEWNLNRLDSLLRHAVPEDIRGVTTSYCYVGSWKALFCWHKEDLDLSAINFLHEGKSKFWYSIPSDQGHLLEREAIKHFPEHFSKCGEHFRHKTTLINPYLLKRKIPELKISKAEQRPGEFVLVLGDSYHCGFNFGYNLAEAINYATLSWLRRLPKVKHCNCSKHSVRVNLHSILSHLATTPFAKSLEFEEFRQSLEKEVEKEVDE